MSLGIQRTGYQQNSTQQTYNCNAAKKQNPSFGYKFEFQPKLEQRLTEYYPKEWQLIKKRLDEIAAQTKKGFFEPQIYIRQDSGVSGAYDYEEVHAIKVRLLGKTIEAKENVSFCDPSSRHNDADKFLPNVVVKVINQLLPKEHQFELSEIPTISLTKALPQNGKLQ